MAFGQQAPLDPVFTAIRRSGPSFPPNGALVIAPSILENDQSMPCSSSNCSTPACQSEKHIRLHPRLIPIMGGRMRHQFGLIQRLPLTAGAQDVEDGIGARQSAPRPTAAETVRVHMDRQEAARPPTRHRRPESQSSFCCFVYGTSTLRSLFCPHARYSPPTSYSTLGCAGTAVGAGAAVAGTATAVGWGCTAAAGGWLGAQADSTTVMRMIREITREFLRFILVSLLLLLVWI